MTNGDAWNGKTAETRLRTNKAQIHADEARSEVVTSADSKDLRKKGECYR